MTGTQITILVVAIPFVLFGVAAILAWAGIIPPPKQVTTWLSEDGRVAYTGVRPDGEGLDPDDPPNVGSAVLKGE